MGADPLYMLRLTLHTDRLYQLARERRLPRDDLGYLVHCALREAFGALAPAPFSVIERKDGAGGQIQVLGYGGHRWDDMQEQAKRFANPLPFSAIALAEATEKRMPDDWPPGLRLGFQVRACPVVRMSKAGPMNREGAEVDAFRARCWELPEEEIDRGEVYAEWLEAQLSRHGGARLVAGVTMERFQRRRLLRRTQGEARQGARCERPDAVLRGTLEVSESEKFQGLLRRGVGRHRAFGFGMLLLHPGGTRC